MATVDKDLANPALTYTLDDFIALQLSDEMTYFNYSIIEKQGNYIFTDHNLIDEYIEELIKLSVNVKLSDDEYKKYRYSPDLLAYNVYGSTQLDFVILAANDMVDPQEFNLRIIKLPYNSYLKTFMSEVMTANAGYVEQNRIDNGIPTY